MTDPACPQKAPYVRDQKAGEILHWCACGHSKTQPFCDGSHGALKTGIEPIAFKVEKDGRVAWCGCKRSGHKPLCDGSHKTLK